MTRIPSRLLALIVCALAALLATPAALASAGHATAYYVSLGDSLAEGFQPTFDLDHGYTDQLYALLRQRSPKLEHVKLGCGGESTVSMRFGSQDPAAAFSCGPPEFYLHRYPHKTQLAEAVAFLHAHAGHVALVTIDIGGNDLLGPSGLDAALPNLASILAELRAAAGPGVPIVGATYYHPFLPVVWAGGGLDTLRAEVESIVAVNDRLEAVYATAGDPVADVEGAFATTDFTLVSGTPRNVVNVCMWTWMCAPPPLGPDIHPNTAGYAVMAQAFLAAVEGASS
jgi:lysophospholipase L1-like esterase